ncbi:hypothetical protein FQZ97_1174620 [compost metagenome]
MTHRNVLFLSNALQRGLIVHEGDKSGDLISSAPPENIQELKAVINECLQEAGLSELSQKLGSLSNLK